MLLKEYPFSYNSSYKLMALFNEMPDFKRNVTTLTQYVRIESGRVSPLVLSAQSYHGSSMLQKYSARFSFS